MIKPELVDYINKATAAGKSRDVIGTELRAQGWPEADINETISSLGNSVSPTFNSSPLSSDAGTLAAATTGGVGTLIIKIALVLLVVGGGYAFYAYITSSQSPLSSLSSSSSSQFACADLLPATDFERITGQSASNYVTVPLFSEVVPGIKILTCDYVNQEQYVKNLEDARFVMSPEDFEKLSGGDSKVTFSSSGQSGSLSISSDVMADIATHVRLTRDANYAFSVTSSDQDMTESFNNSTSLYRGAISNAEVDVNVDAGAYSQNSSMSIKGGPNSASLTSTGPDGKARSVSMSFAVTNIPVGAEGLYVETTSGLGGSSLPPLKSIIAFSSDHHSIITIDHYIEEMTMQYDEKTFKPGPYIKKEPWFSKEAAIELAKTIDANLSRY